MAKRNKKQNTDTAVRNDKTLHSGILAKTISLTRKDIAAWKRAWQYAISAELTSRYQLFNLYDLDIAQDALITSQIENRIQSTLGAEFNLTNATGDVDEELTAAFQDEEFFHDIIRAILRTRFYGHTLIELDREADKMVTHIIPNQNVLPVQGIFLKDYSSAMDDTANIRYRNLPEYGTWLLEFGKPDDLGLLNKAVPHVLFKKFAQSCWSELCEIYGIPPRVYKTDTNDPRALNRGKKMMTEMGAAAWFIIDTTEAFEWAKGVDTNGDVYSNLIRLCDNQNSLLIQGAIIGQDTEHGSYGKDAAGQNLLNNLVAADMALVEMQMKTKVIPALIRIGLLPEGTGFEFEAAEDTEELWKMTREVLPYYNIDTEWIKKRFGIEVTEKKEASPFSQFSADSFFV